MSFKAVIVLLVVFVLRYRASTIVQVLTFDLDKNVDSLLTLIREFNSAVSKPHFSFTLIRSTFNGLSPLLRDAYGKIKETQFPDYPTASLQAIEKALKAVERVSNETLKLKLVQESSWSSDPRKVFRIDYGNATVYSVNNHGRFADTLLRFLSCPYRDKCYRRQATINSATTDICAAKNRVFQTAPQEAFYSCSVDGKRSRELLGPPKDISFDIAAAVELAALAFAQLPLCIMAAKVDAPRLQEHYDEFTGCLRDIPVTATPGRAKLHFEGNLEAFLIDAYPLEWSSLISASIASEFLLKNLALVLRNETVNGTLAPHGCTPALLEDSTIGGDTLELMVDASANLSKHMEQISTTLTLSMAQMTDAVVSFVDAVVHNSRAGFKVDLPDITAVPGIVSDAAQQVEKLLKYIAVAEAVVDQVMQSSSSGVNNNSSLAEEIQKLQQTEVPGTQRDDTANMQQTQEQALAYYRNASDLVAELLTAFNVTLDYSVRAVSLFDQLYKLVIIPLQARAVGAIPRYDAQLARLEGLSQNLTSIAGVLWISRIANLFDACRGSRRVALVSSYFKTTFEAAAERPLDVIAKLLIRLNLPWTESISGNVTMLRDVISNHSAPDSDCQTSRRKHQRAVNNSVQAELAEIPKSSGAGNRSVLQPWNLAEFAANQMIYNHVLDRIRGNHTPLSSLLIAKANASCQQENVSRLAFAALAEAKQAWKHMQSELTFLNVKLAVFGEVAEHFIKRRTTQSSSPALLLALAMPVILKTKALASLGGTLRKLSGVVIVKGAVYVSEALRNVPRYNNLSELQQQGVGWGELSACLWRVSTWLEARRKSIHDMAKANLASLIDDLMKTELQDAERPASKLIMLAASNDKIAARIYKLSLNLATLPSEALLASGSVFAANLAYARTFAVTSNYKLEASTTSSSQFFKNAAFFDAPLMTIRNAAIQEFQAYQSRMRAVNNLDMNADLLGWRLGTRRGNLKVLLEFLRGPTLTERLGEIIATTGSLNVSLQQIRRLQDMISELTEIYAKSKNAPMELRSDISFHKGSGEVLHDAGDSLLSNVDYELKKLKALYKVSMVTSVNISEWAELSADSIAILADAVRPFDDIVTHQNLYLELHHFYNEIASEKIAMAISLKERIISRTIADSVVSSVAERFAASTAICLGRFAAKSEDLAEFVLVETRIIAWLQAALDCGNVSDQYSRVNQLLSEAASQVANCNGPLDNAACKAALASLVAKARTTTIDLMARSPSAASPRWLQTPMRGATNFSNERRIAVLRDRLLDRLEVDYNKFFEKPLKPYLEKLSRDLVDIRSGLHSIASASDRQVLMALVKASEALDLLAFHNINTMLMLKSLGHQIGVLATDTVEYLSVIENATMMLANRNASGANLLQASLNRTIVKQARRIEISTKSIAAVGQGIFGWSALNEASSLVIQVGAILGPQEALAVIRDGEGIVSRSKETYAKVQKDVMKEIIQEKEAAKSNLDAAAKAQQDEDE